MKKVEVRKSHSHLFEFYVHPVILRTAIGCCNREAAANQTKASDRKINLVHLFAYFVTSG